MIEELATGVDMNSESITVVCDVKSACSGCKQLDSCGSGQVAKAFPQKQLSIDLITELAVKKDDTVVIGLSEQCVLESAWQVYLLPVLFLISFSALGQWLVEQLIFSHEIYAIALGMGGGYLGYRLARNLQSSKNKIDKLVPKVLRILPKTIPVTEISSD
jgi:sigma-E factor negative regulatory protein RseC